MSMHVLEATLGSRPIGSDFESLPDGALVSEHNPPWEKDGRATAYAETGRQVLAVIATILSRRGYDRVLVPGYLCQSMVEPFLRLGWRVTPIEMSADLRLQSSAHAIARVHAGRTVVLLASYFGRPPDAAHLGLARLAHKMGALVVEDETHRVFSPGVVEADIYFASLRKLLPVADGAYVQGDREVVDGVAALSSSEGRRWDAMDTMRLATHGEKSNLEYRAFFAKANNELEDPARVRGISDRSRETLRRIPYNDLADIRRRNNHALRTALVPLGSPVLDREPLGTPSHLVVTVDQPTIVQRLLANEQIYCPIHWRRVRCFSGLHKWRTDLLSLPIDHRYGPSDMLRLARAVGRAMLL